MRLIALQKFTYGNVVLEVGDIFEASSDEDARLLKGFGRARDFIALEKELDQRNADAEKPRRGRYRRNDLRADD